MDIKYMEYVLALAKAGNITQAAKDLYISQPIPWESTCLNE